MIYYLTHPKLVTLFTLTGIFILIGVILFTTLENWSVIDAFYYTVSTITTVGYGDITPTHPISRLVATMYMLLTVPLILLSVGLTAEVVHDNVKKPSRSRKKK